MLKKILPHQLFLFLAVILLAGLLIGGWTAEAFDDASLIYTSSWQQGSDSYDAAEETTNMLEYLFNLHSGTYTVYNLFDEDTTKSNIYYYASYCEDTYDGLAFFHYGHFLPLTEYAYYIGFPIPIDHSAYADSDGYFVKDWELFPNTDEGKHYFVFLWTCVNGEGEGEGENAIAGYYDEDIPPWYAGTGAVRMPYAFTHRDDLSNDGYTYPDESWYCFFGFNGTSRWLNETCADPGNEYIYEDFAVLFYYFVLGNNISINTALDWTCDYIWSEYFYEADHIRNYLGEDMQGQLTVPSGLHVWGNGELKFPK